MVFACQDFERENGQTDVEQKGPKPDREGL
jgi:hypothetical protein